MTLYKQIQPPSDNDTVIWEVVPDGGGGDEGMKDLLYEH